MTAPEPVRQRGIILLLLMLVLTVTGSGLLIAAINTHQNPQLQQRQQVMAELTQAKEALLAYATHHADLHAGTVNGPGTLPCVDADGDAAGEPDCLAGATVGRLPRRVPVDSGHYHLSETLAGIDRQFWYAVSATFLPGAVPLNSQTPSDLGYDPALVALLAAPGEAGPQQDRLTAPTVADYLEVIDADGDRLFPADSNDVTLGITLNELMPLMTLQAARAVLAAIEETGNPMPADADAFHDLDTGPDWLRTNRWIGPDSASSVTTYTRIDDDSAALVFAGCAITFTLALVPTPDLSRDNRSC